MARVEADEALLTQRQRSRRIRGSAPIGGAGDAGIPDRRDGCAGGCGDIDGVSDAGRTELGRARRARLDGVGRTRLDARLDGRPAISARLARDAWRALTSNA